MPLLLTSRHIVTKMEENVKSDVTRMASNDNGTYGNNCKKYH